MLDDILDWLAWASYYLSPVIVLVIAAKAWQRHPHRPFFVFAVASMLTVVLVFANAALARHQLTESERLAWHRCSQAFIIIDGLLYPWSLLLMFRFIRDRLAPKAEDQNNEREAGRAGDGL
jgi:hypothetical protein